MKFLPTLIVTLAFSPAWATAQVSVNPAALAQLAGIAPTPPAAAAPQPVMHPVHRRLQHRHAIVAVAKPVLPAPVTAPIAKPVAAAARVAAPLPAPKAPAAPALPPPPLAASLIFAAGSAALPANAGAALKPFCKSTELISISARAPGDASDPSIAMRLSLARALAVRDALAACGVPAQNILPRALGTISGQNEDETVLGTEK